MKFGIKSKTFHSIHKKYEEPYFALATWQEAAQIFVTFVYHCTYIADWENFKTIFEKKE